MQASGVPNYVLTEHALFEMQRRRLDQQTVKLVLVSPEQRFTLRPGRILLQSRVAMGVPAKPYLIRVVVDVNRDPPEVVTVYRTSKVAKYWKVQL
jgi:hypothetical protein